MQDLEQNAERERRRQKLETELLEFKKQHATDMHPINLQKEIKNLQLKDAKLHEQLSYTGREETKMVRSWEQVQLEQQAKQEDRQIKQRSVHTCLHYSC